ncbi:MAG TPA: hypothetical protein VMQ76_02840 [Terracidiphilus sp.]|nr:hypothetical protein [Terracidiphilus sp.]
MTALDVVKQWGSAILAALAFIGVFWNRLHIEHLDVRADGLEIKYEKAASRADRAEATVDEKNDARDRADLKEERGKQ